MEGGFLMHEVIRNFKDQDGSIYNVGDAYPNSKAKKPTNARIKVLSSTNNKYNQIYIVKKSLEKE